MSRIKRISTFILCIVLLAGISSLFVACRKDNGTESPSIGVEEKEHFETETLFATINSYLQNEIYTGEDLPLMMEYQNALLKKITYEIQSVDLDHRTMDVAFTYIDVLQLADSITDPNIAEEDYYAACVDKISSSDYQTITEVVTVGFELAEEDYILIQSEELTNVLSGGVLDYYLELLEEMGHE